MSQAGSIAERIRQVQAPVIPIVGRWTLEHPGTISLGQGIVHYPPPTSVFRSVAEQAQTDRDLDRYGAVVGDADLLQRFREKLAAENGIDADAESIVCSSGANMGFLNAVLAIADVGDEIILFAPYYFNHQMAIEIAGCRAVVVPTDAEYQPDLEALAGAITAKTRAVVTVSPNNPTGAVYPRETLTAINRLCERRGVYHISDEAYEYFTYGVEHFSPGSLHGSAAHTVSLFSLSKAYGLAGWRIGYSVVPGHLGESVRKIQDTNLICPPKVCQVAAAAAMDVGSSWCREQINGFKDVRDAAIQSLAKLGSRCELSVPEGAFYLFLRLQSEEPDLRLVESLIREFGVAVLPGSAFGSTARCSIRLSYGALEPETVREGIGRLCRGLTELL
ncbi:MAG: pyridoxal phosphate-dependent aminotransferase [Planctomycetota bacterium]